MEFSFFSKRNVSRLLLFSGSIFSILVFFQNCGSQFQVVSDKAELSSLAVLTPPQVSFDVAPDVININQYTMSFKISNVADTDIKSITCQLGLATPVDCISKTVTFPQLVDGDYQIKIAAETKAGVKSETVKLFRKDATAPVLNILSQPVAVTNQTTAAISVSVTDNLAGVDRVECALDAAAYASCVMPINLTNITAGAHTFKVRAFDRAGNTSNAIMISWTVDLAVPTVTFSQMPLALNNMTTATFAFAGAGIVSYECSLDAGAFAACTSPQNLTGLVAGAHTFRVRGANAVGNVSVPLAFTWTVDLAVPTIAFSQTPPATTNQTTATFVFAGANVVSYECSLDNAAFAACTSPRNITGLAAGAHTFRARGTTAAGNVSALITHAWTVDLTAPTVTLSQMPNSNTNQTTATFAFSGVGIVSYECSLDNVAFAACTSPRAITGLTAGAHTFRVRGTNAVGNVSAVVMYSWTVDLTAPTLNLSQMPNSNTNQTTATFAFSGASTYECQLDAAAYAACTSPHVLSNLTAASHTFRVRGTSAAGNVSAPVMYSWTVDLTVPTLTIAQKPNANTNQTTATFTFSGAGIVSYECKMDSAAYAACTSPYNLTGLTAGSHTVSIRGSSAAGNVSAPISHSWNIELAASNITLSQTPTAVTNSTTAQFAFSGSNIASFECQLDAAAFVACTSPQNYTNLSSAARTFRVRGTSLAGNVSAVTTFNWTVDATPPTVTITSSPVALTNQTSASFGFSGTNAIRFECQLDGVAFSACSSPVNYTNVSNGNHTFYVRAFSNSGLVSAVSTFVWMVDASSPSAPSIASNIGGNSTSSPSPTFTFTSLDNVGVVQYECSFNKGDYVMCASPQVFVGAVLGSNVIDIRARDGAGNVSPVSSSSWFFDSVAPNIPTLTHNLTGTATSQTSVTFNFSSSDSGTGVSSYRCVADGVTTNPCASPQTLQNLAQGSHSFSVVAVDGVGNVSSAASISWTVVAPATEMHLAVSDAHSCFVSSTGSVKCWGENRSGQLGNNSIASSLAPVTVSGLSNAKLVAVGSDRSCALTTAGSVYCWGGGAFTPVQVSGITGAKFISAGPAGLCVVTAQNTVKCGAFNSTSSTITLGADIANLSSVTQVSVTGQAYCAITSAGAIKCWGQGYGNYIGGGQYDIATTPVDVSGITGKQIQSTSLQTCVVTNQDTIKCWTGRNDFGTTPTFDLTDGPTGGLAGAKQVSPGYGFGCAITSSNGVKCWGYYGWGQLGNNVSLVGAYTQPGSINAAAVDVAGLTNVKQVVSSLSHTCALDSAGSIKCWGKNSNGQLGLNNELNYRNSANDSNLNNLSQIDVFRDQGCGISAQNSLKCWGEGTTVSSTGFPRRSPVVVDLGVSNVTQLTKNCALTSAGTVYCWGFYAPIDTPHIIPGLNDAAQIATLSSGLCVMTAQGVVKCLLNNVSSCMQNAASCTWTNYVTGAKQIAGVSSSVCAVTSTDTVKCWGTFGNSLTTPVYNATPVDVTGMSGVRKLFGNNDAYCAVHDNDIQCWGNNLGQKLGDPSQSYQMIQNPVATIPIAGAIAVSIGYDLSCAITASRTVKCWGRGAGMLLGQNSSVNPLAPIDIPGITQAQSIMVSGRGLIWTNTAGQAYRVGVTQDYSNLALSLLGL